MTKHLLITLATLIVLTSCEPFYNPVDQGDVPTTQGLAWDKKPIIVKKTVEIPYTVNDLSGPLPLSRLLDIALYNNPSTRASWNAARASAYEYRVSLSEYYPALDYSGGIAAQTNKGTPFANSGQAIITSATTPVTSKTQTFRTYAFNELNLTYLLLDFGGRDANSEFALQTLYASNWQHNFTMQQVMLSVLTAYTSYMGNRGLVITYTLNLKDAQIALDAAQLMKRNGLATLSDVLEAQANLEQTRTNLIQSQGSENIALGELLIALGLPADAPLAIEDLPKELPVIQISGDISSLLELAKKSRPDLGVAIAAIKQQEALLAVSYSSGMPTLSANLNWSQTRFISPRSPSGYTEVAALEVDFPIFQGFYYMNQQRQLRAQVEEAMANLDVQVAVVSSQVVTAYYSLLAAEAALPSAQAAVDYSERAYRGYVIQYKTGTSSMLNIINALTILSNARAQEVLTRTQWAASLANLSFAVGALEENSGSWKKGPPKALFKLSIKNDDKTNNESDPDEE